MLRVQRRYVWQEQHVVAYVRAYAAVWLVPPVLYVTVLKLMCCTAQYMRAHLRRVGID